MGVDTSPASRVPGTVDADVGGGDVSTIRDLRIVDFRRLNVRHPCVAMVPQWDLLDPLAEAGKGEASFIVGMRTEVTGLICESGRAERESLPHERRNLRKDSRGPDRGLRRPLVDRARASRAEAQGIPGPDRHVVVPSSQRAARIHAALRLAPVRHRARGRRPAVPRFRRASS
jgi:hypothetical protein